MAVNKRVLLTSRPTGIPEPQHFTIDTAPQPDLRAGGFIVRNILLSIDPAQRGWASDGTNYAPPVPLGTPMRALTLGEVTASATPEVAVGEYLYGWFGWQSFAFAEPSQIVRRFTEHDLPLSSALGVLGINGLTAWIALDRCGVPRAGETVLVTTAAGAVGSIVGQLAAARGLTPVGLTGGGAKVTRCVERYRYVAAIDYRSDSDIGAALDVAAPTGFDVFFDNTGGPLADLAIRRMRTAGRIVQCGTVATAHWTPPPQGPRPEREVLTRRLRWSGFVIFDHADAFDDAAAGLADMMRAGQLVFDEDIEDGIECAPSALAGLYRGENKGKKIIRV